jgi:hypothetical protein
MSRITFNPFTGEFDQVRTTSIDVDSAGVIESAVNREIDSAVSNPESGIIALHTDSVIAKEIRPGGAIHLAIDSDFDIHLDAELAPGGKIDDIRESSDGGYEFTGGFTDRTTGTAGASDVGTDVEYTAAMVSAQSWLRFGLDSDAQDSNDSPYWTNGAGSEYEAPGQGTTEYKGKGLFSGFYMPHGVTNLFDFSSDSTTLSYNQAVTSGSLQYNAASGSLDMSQLNEGDFVQVRFDFNATPQFANTTIEVGLIWQTRDSVGNPTFTFALTGEPIFYGNGTTGRTFLNRPILTAYLASNEDVNARALPAIRSDQPIFIQPLTTLFTVGR